MATHRQTPLARLATSPVEISTLAKTPISQLMNLPMEPGVYFAIDNANRVWYTGLAECLRQRLAGHDRMDDFRESGVTAIAWRCEDNEANRRQLERLAIGYFHPPLNDSLNFHKLPVVDLGLTPAEEVDRYLKLRIQQKLIDLQLELIKPNIITRCEEENQKVIHHSLGTIRAQSYKSWQYSEDITRMMDAIKLAKQAEQRNGTATVKAVTISPVARLTASVLWDEITILLDDIESSESSEAA